MSSKVVEAKIVNYGRGPSIAGTRITVYDVMDYYRHGWHSDQIAEVFPRVSSNDIQAAIDYIEAHKEDVLAEYQKILDRHHNFKYSPEVQAKLDLIRGTATRRLQEIRRRQHAENPDADDHGGS
jgi:uncharacterized protein (DUF433 family)